MLLSILKRSHEQAFMDDLTRIPGRRALNIDLAQLSGKYCIAMLDIDHFKQFNDTYGHNTGDMVLKMVASQLATVRGRGKVYRYGGEEFTILFKGKSVSDCVDYLNEVRLLIAGYPFQIRKSVERREAENEEKSVEGIEKVVQVAISIGVAQRGKSTRNPEDVIKEADKLLYKAKESGRNKVCA
ncbi:GGDEF domain-containing protein [Moritella viscosa]